MFEKLDKAIMETITYKGKTLAQWEGGEVERYETAHESVKAEREARATLYTQAIEEGRDIEYIPATVCLTPSNPT